MIHKDRDGDPWVGGFLVDGPAFKKALEDLGYTQSSFSREFRIGLRTVQNWAKIGPPAFVIPFLLSYSRTAIRPPDSQDWSDLEAAARQSAAALDMAMRLMMHRGGRMGWPRDILLAGISHWLTVQIASRHSEDLRGNP